MVHAPPWTIVTSVPETVQVDGVSGVKLTVSDEVAVALTLNGAAPYVTFESEPKVMVCGVVTAILAKNP
jgi:hypothetical protein